MSTQVIYKHSLNRDVLALPEGARVIHSGLDPSGVPCLWEIHDVDAPVGQPRRFTIAGTGEPFPGGTHLGTWIATGLVLHLFELPPGGGQ